MMKIQVLDSKDGLMKFRVEGIKNALASAFRRIMISEIPTMAVETVDFKKNDSALNDEVVANRLGFVPLVFPDKTYNIISECPTCKGKGCSNCQVKLTLKKKGPGMVLSGDLKSTDKDVKPVFDNIPIVELFGDQELQFEATAQLGTGREHVKWQGAVVGYKQEAEGSYVFNVESVSGLKVENVVLKATDVLEDKVKEFQKNLKKLK